MGDEKLCRICGRMKRVPDEIGERGQPTCKTCSAERSAARNRRYYYTRRGPLPEGERLCQWCGYPKAIGEDIAFNADYCFPCKAERQRGRVRYRYHEKQLKMTPAERAKYRERDAAWARAKRKTAAGQATSRAAVKRWRKRNPEKYRESIRKTRAKLTADPEKHAAFLADRRIDYRLRAEREGRAMRGMRPETYANGNGKEFHGGRLDIGPLRELVSEWLGDHHGKPMGGHDWHVNGVAAAGYEQLAQVTGVSDRTLREVAHGERAFVLYETADRICTGLDTPLASLYPDER
jgi:transcriptional regulator with XRE-family HTH domain